MPNPTPAPFADAARVTEAKAKRDAALAQAKREGAEAERAKQGPNIEAAVRAATLNQRIDHQAAIAKLEAKHVDAMQHARWSGTWKGGLFIGVPAMAAGLFAGLLASSLSYDTVARSAREMTLTGAIVSAHERPD